MLRRVVSSALIVLGAVAVPVLAAAPAQSIPKCLAGYQCMRTYYADNSHEQVVGGYTKFCDGSTDVWGTTTSFVETNQAACG